MTVERGRRLVAGIVILVSVTLGMTVNHNWYWLTGFVGLNLFQSASMMSLRRVSVHLLRLSLRKR